MLFIFYYSQWQLTVPFRKARYCITQLENWSYLRLKNQQCSDLNSQAKIEEENKKRGEWSTTWPQDHITNSHVQGSETTWRSGQTSVWIKALIFIIKQNDVREKSTNSTECLMITFKVVIAGKMQHLSIADTSENLCVCQIQAFCSTRPQASAPAPTS